MQFIEKYRLYVVSGAGVVLVLGLLSGFFLYAPEMKERPPEKTPEQKAAEDLAYWRSLQETQTLLEARKGFQTHLVRAESGNTPPPVPETPRLQLIRYPSEVGKLAGYLSHIPEDGQKHPAILWLSGFKNDIGPWTWEKTKGYDLTASAFRERGIVMLYLSLRGGNDNSGDIENSYGEVNDVLSARDYLASLPGIDSSRIYLGAHSGGATLALLVDECSPAQFRAVFCCGPIDKADNLRKEQFRFDQTNPLEFKLRSPIYWLRGIQTETFVTEGADGANFPCLLNLGKSNVNSRVHFFTIPHHDHLNALEVAADVFATHAELDTGASCNIEMDQGEFDKLANR